MIRTNSLTHRYTRSGAPALDDVTAAFAPGSITGLIGPNGSGKTTLLSILAGRLDPTAGSVQIDGVDADRENLVAQAVLVGESQRLDVFRIKDVLRYSRLRPTWDEDAFTHLAKRFDLPRRGSLKRRSQGQRSLFGTCIALASGAPLTLLDEPTANLDVPTRLAIHEEIIAANAESDRSFVVASHLVSELESLVEDVAVINAGRIIAQCSVDEFTARALALVGSREAIEAALAERPNITVSSERPLGRLVEARVSGLTAADRAALADSGLETQPLAFQDAFVAMIERN